MVRKKKFLDENDIEMTVQEKEFALAYMEEGFNGKKAMEKISNSNQSKSLACKMLKKESVNKFINLKLKEKEERFDVAFDWKLKKLKKIIDMCVPDECSFVEDMNPSYAIQAIGELNKMQGHYSGEKRVSINLDLDSDIQEVQEVVKKLLISNRREI